MRTSSLFGIALLSLLVNAGCSSADTPPSADSANLVGTSINVKPFATIGSGNEGNGPEDINPPDGIAFSSTGVLLLTDALNHRMQAWDVKEPRRLGEFGSADIFKGEVVDLAVAPSGKIIVTDEVADIAYGFDPPSEDEEGDAALANYTFTGDLFTEEGFDKVGGIAIDSKGRIYTVDAHKDLVQRYDADGEKDPTWEFEKNDSGSFLHACEGIAIDEKRGNLYVSSEGDSVVQVFDLEDGKYKNQMIGGAMDPDEAGAPVGERMFQRAVEGLWIHDDYLLASDEADGGTGHVQIFDLQESTAFNTGAEGYAKLKKEKERSGYVGSFGKLCSPDSVATFTDEDGETYVAVADQCNFQVLVYRWSDILEAGDISRK